MSTAFEIEPCLVIVCSFILYTYIFSSTVYSLSWAVLNTSGMRARFTAHSLALFFLPVLLILSRINVFIVP